MARGTLFNTARRLAGRSISLAADYPHRHMLSARGKLNSGSCGPSQYEEDRLAASFALVRRYNLRTGHPFGPIMKRQQRD